MFIYDLVSLASKNYGLIIRQSFFNRNFDCFKVLYYFLSLACPAFSLISKYITLSIALLTLLLNLCIHSGTKLCQPYHNSLPFATFAFLSIFTTFSLTLLASLHSLMFESYHIAIINLL